MFVRVVCFVVAILCFVSLVGLPLLATYLAYEGPTWFVREVAEAKAKGVPSTVFGSFFIAALLLALGGVFSAIFAFKIEP